MRGSVVCAMWIECAWPALVAASEDRRAASGSVRVKRVLDVAHLRVVAVHRDMDIGDHGHRVRRDGTGARVDEQAVRRSEEHTSELQSLMRISYAVFCLKKKKDRQKRAIN